jgi:hypothetical protein
MEKCDISKCFRAEMARLNIGIESVNEALSLMHSEYTGPTPGWNTQRLSWLAKVEKGDIGCSPVEIGTIAIALGCPVDRLIVDRVELEARVASLTGALDEVCGQNIEGVKTKTAQRISDLVEYMSFYRPEVRSFARVMENKLRANDHKIGWHHEEWPDLVERMQGKMVKLIDALSLHGCPEEAPQDIVGEAADVANFCLMIADNSGQLEIGKEPWPI